MGCLIERGAGKLVAAPADPTLNVGFAGLTAARVAETYASVGDAVKAKLFSVSVAVVAFAAAGSAQFRSVDVALLGSECAVQCRVTAMRSLAASRTDAPSPMRRRPVATLVAPHQEPNNVDYERNTHYGHDCRSDG